MNFLVFFNSTVAFVLVVAHQLSGVLANEENYGRVLSVLVNIQDNFMRVYVDTDKRQILCLESTMRKTEQVVAFLEFSKWAFEQRCVVFSTGEACYMRIAR